MRFIYLSLISILLISCSGINVERKTDLRFDSLFFAKVNSRKSVAIEPNESKAGRVFVGLISAGPIGAIATANTEEGFGQPKAFEYDLYINSDESKTIISRSIVDVGSCVEVISPDGSDIELLRVVSVAKCENSYNKALHPTSG